MSAGPAARARAVGLAAAVRRARPERPRPGTRLLPARPPSRLRAPRPQPCARPRAAASHSRRAPRVPATPALGSAQAAPTFARRRRRRGVQADPARGSGGREGGGGGGVCSRPSRLPASRSPRDHGRRGRGRGEVAAGWPQGLSMARLLGQALGLSIGRIYCFPHPSTLGLLALLHKRETEAQASGAASCIVPLPPWP